MDTFDGKPAISIDDETLIVYEDGFMFLYYKLGDKWSWQYLNLNARPSTAAHFEPAARKLYEQLVENGLVPEETRPWAREHRFRNMAYLR